MGKKSQGGYYAVARGRNRGVYRNWDSCEAQVKGYSNARYKKFSTAAEANDFVNGYSGVSSYGKVTKNSYKSNYQRSSSAYDYLEEEEYSDNDDDDDRSGSNFQKDSLGNIICYTDGACEGNGQASARAGIGVWWGKSHPYNSSEPIKGSKVTNNAAEIQAAIKAVDTAKNSRSKISNLVIRTDSQFMINCVEKWMANWKKNGWIKSKGGEVANRDDLQVLDNLLTNSGINVRFEHVKGHSGIEGNEMADRLAVAGASKMTL